jgi:CheY-like chemotaxis protein
MKDVLVLLVDDEDAVRSVMTESLRRAGAVVEPVRSGAKAIGWLESAETLPALLVCDVQMPVMNGYELTRAVRELHPSIVILLVSGFLTNEDAAIEAGATRVARKPMLPSELVSECKRTLAAVE